MKKIIPLAAMLVLAACNNAASEGDSADAGSADAMASDGVNAPSGVLEGQAPGFEAVAPGTYQVTRAGGEVDHIEIHPGMTFSRVDADGTATGGSIFMKNGETCFLVEGQEQENCFEDGPRQPDGTMRTTSGSGDVSSVRPVEGTLADHVETAT